MQGAVQTMVALAKHPQKRSAGITMMGKSVELAGHLVSSWEEAALRLEQTPCNRPARGCGWEAAGQRHAPRLLCLLGLHTRCCPCLYPPPQIAERVPEKTLGAMRGIVQSLAGGAPGRGRGRGKAVRPAQRAGLFAADKDRVKAAPLMHTALPCNHVGRKACSLVPAPSGNLMLRLLPTFLCPNISLPPACSMCCPADENFSYDVEYITSAMGWDAAAQPTAADRAGGTVSMPATSASALPVPPYLPVGFPLLPALLCWSSRGWLACLP